MALSQELRKVATDLSLKVDEASQRRAISTAYYAVFHLFCDEGLKLIYKDPNSNSFFIASRSFNHGTMKKVCEKLAGEKGINKQQGNRYANNTYDNIILHYDSEIENLARFFIELQESRHEADYNLQKNIYLFNSSLTNTVTTTINTNRLNQSKGIKTMDDVFDIWEHLIKQGKINLLNTFISLLLFDRVTFFEK